MRRLHRVYYGQVTYVDRKLGAWWTACDRSGNDNTVILFTADHGDMLGRRLMVEKRTFYEPAARVPLIVRWPQRWPGGASRGEPVSLIDIFPTLVELTHAQPAVEIDGRSFFGLLDGRSDAGRPRAVISEYHGEGVTAPCLMIRKGDFKYVYIHGHEGQLFNLRLDPGEWHNLAASAAHHDIAASLRQRL